MISIKILENEHQSASKTLERKIEELDYHEEQVEILKKDIEESKTRMQDLKTAISKLTEQ